MNDHIRPFARFHGSFALRFIAAALFVGFLPGCSSSGVDVTPDHTNRERAELYKDGSLIRDTGGFYILGGPDEKSDKNNGIGVNGYLWRAALDTVSFLPLSSADPFGGVIASDWYTPPQTPGERVKVNVFILDRELRADGVKVSTFRQIKGPKGDWQDAPVAATTASTMEEAILTRARQLRLAQKEKK